MIDFQNERPDPLRRLVRKAAEIVPMSGIRPRLVVGIDREVFRLSCGRTTMSALVSGLPIVMLTTTGARTGHARAVPVLGLPDDDRLILIASNFGTPSTPAGITTCAHTRMQWSPGMGPQSRCMPASWRVPSGSGTSTSASRSIRGGSPTTAALRPGKSQ
jgi:F420H(2)-dependent quinone reductase